MASFDAFSSDHITEPKYLVREYRFYLGQLGPITIRVWKTRESYGDCTFTFTQSHYIKTPTQAGPYMTSAPFGETEERAINRAVQGFLTWYTGAIHEGHEPDESWLVPSEHF
jgi:hypothetical protein